jgi:hypothetical protein
VADLPGVGRDLQDHPGTSLVFEVTERTLNQDVTPVRLVRTPELRAARSRRADLDLEPRRRVRAW